MTMTKTESADAGELGFESGMQTLEGIVARLESGELPLEQALQEFEAGVNLVRKLNEKLSAAEQRVEVLSRAENGSLQLSVLGCEEP